MNSQAINFPRVLRRKLIFYAGAWVSLAVVLAIPTPAAGLSNSEQPFLDSQIRLLVNTQGGEHGNDTYRDFGLLLVGTLPSWPYSSGWGYYPSGGLGLVLLIVLILALLGRI